MLFEEFFSDVMSVQYPFFWTFLSLALFRREIFQYIKKRYIEENLYVEGAERSIFWISAIASIVFAIVSGFDLMGISLKLVIHILGDRLYVPLIFQILAYIIRCFITIVIEWAVFSVLWNCFLIDYFRRKFGRN